MVVGSNPTIPAIDHHPYYDPGGLGGGRPGIMAKTAAWQRKEGKSKSGGLNAKGRASYNKETGGNLKPPVSKEQAAKSDADASRRKSFCKRMKGHKSKNTSAEVARDPNSRINKALRKWDC